MWLVLKCFIIIGTCVMLSAFAGIGVASVTSSAYRCLGYGVSACELSTLGASSGVVIAVLVSVIVVLLLFFTSDTLACILSPLRGLMQQMNRINLKIPDLETTTKQLDQQVKDIQASAEAVRSLGVVVDDLRNKVAELSPEEIERLRNTISKQLKGVLMGFDEKGIHPHLEFLTLSSVSDKFTDEHEVVYFNAIQTGNWRPL